MGTMRKAIFLDSDGVLNVAIVKEGKPLAPVDLDEFVIPEEVRPCLVRLKAEGYLLICVSNKPDIERGLMTQKTVDLIYQKMQQELPLLDDIFLCYHENSSCYKPKPGMLLDAAQKYAINLKKSVIVGDRWRDIEAGRNAGCHTVWIDRGYINDKIPELPIDCIASSLTEATDWIVGSLGHGE